MSDGPDYDRMIDCAAIKMPDGRVWTGKRHHHCIATIVQATGKPCRDGVQGFVTMSGKFLDRDEARALVEETGQVTKFTRPKQLYSEDLY
jgi:hypothetical protein